jgi:hypothetical protein
MRERILALAAGVPAAGPALASAAGLFNPAAA